MVHDIADVLDTVAFIFIVLALSRVTLELMTFRTRICLRCHKWIFEGEETVVCTRKRLLCAYCAKEEGLR